MGIHSLNLLTGISKTIFINSTERYLDCHENTLQWVVNSPIVGIRCHSPFTGLYKMMFVVWTEPWFTKSYVFLWFLIQHMAFIKGTFCSLICITFRMFNFSPSCRLSITLPMSDPNETSQPVEWIIWGLLFAIFNPGLCRLKLRLFFWATIDMQVNQFSVASTTLLGRLVRYLKSTWLVTVSQHQNFTHPEDCIFQELYPRSLVGYPLFQWVIQFGHSKFSNVNTAVLWATTY